MYFEVVPIEWKGKKVLVSSKMQEGPPSMQSRTVLTHFILHNEWDVTHVCATAKTFPDQRFGCMLRTLEAGSASLGSASGLLVPR